jgi:uncharacterized membrane protein YbaN (DUF454 family)
MKWIFISLGGLSIFSGLITFWLPIPIGLPLILVGLALIARHSPTGRRWISWTLDRFPWVRSGIQKLRAQKKSADHDATQALKADEQNRS